MKIKVSFSKVVDADSIDDAYAKIMDDFEVLVGENLGSTVEKYFDSSEIPPWENAAIPQPTYEKTTHMKRDTEVTEMNGFTFEDLGEHTGYGEGSIQDWTDDQ
jgi:hypothetical protein